MSVQRRGRCSVSCFILRKTSFCFLLHSSGFTVCLSKDVTGALLPTPLTPFCFLLLSPFFENLFVWLLSLLPRFLVWVVSLNVTGVSVQRRGRYAPPFSILPSPPFVCLSCHTLRTSCSQPTLTKPKCLSMLRPSKLLQKVLVHLD